MTIYVGFEIEIEAGNNTNISGNSEDRYNLIYHLAKETTHITGLNDVTIYRYHKNVSNSLAGKWRLEHDDSLSCGAEFITPPLEINNALETLKKFLLYVDKCACITTHRTGLHINMSSTNMDLDDINIDNIIPQINYKLLFNLWKSRFEKNGYSMSLKSLLQNNKQSILYSYYNNTNSRKIEKLSAINKILLNRRVGFINLRKDPDKRQYFEIRIAGGTDYHKKFKNIEQTVRHFEKILLDSQKNSTKSYKSLVSYVNRLLNCNKEDKLFIPSLFKIDTPYLFAKKNIPLIKKVHNYNIDQLYAEMHQINTKRYFIRAGTRLTLLNVINTYFKQYMGYIYKNLSCDSPKNREKEYNYVIYHYCKYIYNNFGKKECIDALYNKKYYRLYPINMTYSGNYFDFSIPKDEPKQEVLWLIDCVKELDTATKKQFVSKLPFCMLNFLLAHKRPGMINVTKRAKKELIKEKLKEKTDTERVGYI